jgi:cytochrome c oxidase subunit 3
MSGSYYVPAQSRLPIFTALGLGLCGVGAAFYLNALKAGEANAAAPLLLMIGFLVLAAVLYAWFSMVVKENIQGLNNAQLNRSYVQGMSWFIFSEVMFFVAFFGALFYVRNLVGPWLGGEGAKGVSNMLFATFEFTWPSLENPDNRLFAPPHSTVNPMGIPLINTLLLFTSSLTLSGAHHALIYKNREHFIFLLLITIALGLIFLGFQIFEYYEAYTHLGLTLGSGIYGSTFFLLTGFHGAHVTIGTLMLIIMAIRTFRGHFTHDNHFGFTASAWYWHFVDVVWMALFVFVYLL